MVPCYSRNSFSGNVRCERSLPFLPQSSAFKIARRSMTIFSIMAPFVASIGPCDPKSSATINHCQVFEEANMSQFNAFQHRWLGNIAPNSFTSIAFSLKVNTDATLDECITQQWRCWVPKPYFPLMQSDRSPVICQYIDCIASDATTSRSQFSTFGASTVDSIKAHTDASIDASNDVCCDNPTDAPFDDETTAPEHRSNCTC
ncbi:hypothetical protein CCR75_004173 [Bremia lactucae]|uniref:Uncharacterized protein n=1 Tax=Bremia lactucae TaxID=4779 RepID=A0A976IE06_BRELC|nr:hypothetical protein CCR75_004173 [Bremia lactucae]